MNELEALRTAITVAMAVPKDVLWALFMVYVYLSTFYTLFLAYSAVKNLGWSNLSDFAKVLTAPFAIVFVVMDFLFNVTAGTVLFLQLPTRTTLTLSMRMANNIRTMPATWRGRLSMLIVQHMLLPFTKYY